MGWNALVPPRKGTQDATGMCLRFAQSFFGAPVAHPSAWVAWQHVQGKYAPSDPLPNVPVILWFEHWGTYGSPPTYANWGHVAAYVPGDAIYTSPTYGYGQQRYGTIAEIEQAFNCRYVGWSPDINGLLVADYTTTTPVPRAPAATTIPEGDEMAIYLEANSSSTAKPGVNGGVARIWAGDRTIGGIEYSSVWERLDDGTIRRLYKTEWAGIKAAYASAKRMPLHSKVAGDVLDQIIYGKRA